VEISEQYIYNNPVKTIAVYGRKGQEPLNNTIAIQEI
jgi:hypothetical protein